MRQLDTCDFCGDAADGVYDVVPASIADQPRRLALCEDCRDTLRFVVDPLLEAAEAAEPADGDRTPAERDGGASSAEPASSGPEGDASADGDGVTAAERDEPDSTDAGRAERPEGYGHVLRLLQNRDDAMPRDDLRALATNAYDLDPDAFERAVDAAVENGDVEETEGGLRTA